MYYLRPTPNPGGAYGAPQSSKAPGLLELPDSLLSEFLAYTGFVTLTVEGEAVTAVTPDAEAWEAWKASLPPDLEPEPTQLDRVEAQATYTAMMTDTLLEG